MLIRNWVGIKKGDIPMNSIKRALRFSMLVAGLTVAFSFSGGMAGAVDNKSETKEKNTTTQNSQKKTEVVYQYVAQPGDSYSEMARKAVQTYGLKYKKNTTQAGIIFAETNLTQLAGSPLLDEGQKVEFTETMVKEWFEKSQKLTDAQKAAWAVYAEGVDFNTNAVGEES